MTRLAEIQQRFQAYVLSAETAVQSAVEEQGAVGVERRLDVYYQAYRLRLIEVMGDDFPGVKQLAAEGFEALCRAYIEASPSRHFNLRWYAAGFADFLLTRADSESTSVLAEMAAFEWDLGLCFDAIDQTPIGLQQVAAISPQDWGAMRFGFASCLRLRPLHWNVAAIRLAIDRDAMDAMPPPLRLSEPQLQAMWRHDWQVRHRSLAADEAAALDLAQQGGSFGDLCGLLCRWHAEETVALRAAELLKTWVHDQWIVGLSLAAAEH